MIYTLKRQYPEQLLNYRMLELQIPTLYTTTMFKF